MKRGEIWWADLPRPAGRRPVVLLSRDEAYAVRELITVAPVTTRIRGVAAEVPLGREDGMPKACAANLDTITTIPKATIRDRIAYLRAGKRRALDDAIRFALGLDEGP
jgi:mRNA interferase MazF